MENLRRAVAIVEQVLETGGQADQTAGLPLSTPSLNDAAWQTADRTTALGLMDYTDVKEYAEVYALQDMVIDSQRRIVERLTGFGIGALALQTGDLASLTPASLQAFRERLYEAIVAVDIHLNLVSQLADDYRNAPTR
jgi:hypothetical protein